MFRHCSPECWLQIHTTERRTEQRRSARDLNNAWYVTDPTGKWIFKTVCSTTKKNGPVFREPVAAQSRRARGGTTAKEPAGKNPFLDHFYPIIACKCAPLPGPRRPGRNVLPAQQIRDRRRSARRPFHNSKNPPSRHPYWVSSSSCLGSRGGILFLP